MVDLSGSTNCDFSSTVPIGDVNGDGLENTILDAQVIAIQDLLTSIAESETLNNTNCEIELITFESGALSHSIWKPLNNAGEGAGGDAFNPELLEHIKNLRASGKTNFDEALDLTVEYFQYRATPNRTNLLVFMSDGEPNIEGVSFIWLKEGMGEGFCFGELV